MSTTILAFLGLTAFLFFAKNICMPIVLGIFLYFLLDPFVEKLECKYFPRMVISPLLIVVVLGFVFLGAWATFATVAQISAHFPEYAEKVKNLTGFFITLMEKLVDSTTQLFPDQKVEVQKVEVAQSMGDITSQVLSALDTIVGLLGSIFIVPILSLFFLIEKHRIKEKIRALNLFAERGDELAQKTAQIVQGFFLGNLIAGLGSSFCFFAIFALLHLENSVALSMGAGFLNLVPIIGAFLAMLFPMAQGLLQYSSFAPFLTMIVSSLVIHFFIGNFILPKLMGKHVDLNVTAATIGMLFWGWLWGAVGIFLAVPLMAVIKVLCGLSPKTKALESALSQSPRRSGSIIIMESFKSLRN